MTALKTSRKYDIIILVIAAMLFFVALKVHQYNSYDLKGEISDYETVLWNSLEGNPLQMKCTRMSFFSEHFSPVLFVFLPAYALFKSPLILLILHGMICALALIPLYYLTADFTKLRWPPIAMCLAFIFAGIVNKGLFYDFKPEMLYPLLFFCAFLAFRKEKWAVYYLVLLLCASVKEDAFIAIAGLGLFQIFSLKRTAKLHGAVTALFAFIGLICVMQYVMPFFRFETAGSEYKFAGYWGGYGTTRDEILLNFLNPLAHIRVIFTPDKISSMLNLFLDFAFLPFACWQGLIFLVLPNWFILFSSNIESLNSVSIYYGLLIAPFLFFATILGIDRISRKWQRHCKIIFISLSSLVLITQFCDSRLFKTFNISYWKVPDRIKTANEIIRAIPRGSMVSAQVNLISHTPPHPLRSNFPNSTDNADYIFLDKHGDKWPLPDKEYEKHLSGYLNSPEWEIKIEKDDYLLLKRK
ncbi:DUF2079 domain-containing protein [Candidatus Auribacterota bacterium]